MSKRVPLTETELSELNLYSDLHEELVEILLTHGESMSQQARFAIEDSLLAAITPKESRSDFVELSMLSAGAPHLIRAVESKWPHSRVFVSPFQNPESLGVELSMIIFDKEEDIAFPSIADTILDEVGKIVDPLKKV